MRFALCALRLIKGVECMNILTKRNGIALVAVLAVLLILTLLLPLMFNMSENALYSAVNGTDIQRASYLARSVCEMAVGTYKSTYNAEIPSHIYDIESIENCKTPSDIEYFKVRLMKDAYDQLYLGELSAINTNEVTMYSKKPTGVDAEDVSKEDIIYSTEPNVTAEQISQYKPVGTGKCVITFENQHELYLMDSAGGYYNLTEEQYNILQKDVYNVEDPYVKHPELIEEITQLSSGVLENLTFTVSKVDNRKIIFDATATVNGFTQTRQCVLVLPTYPAKQQWLIFQGPDCGTRNELFINPEKATGYTTINYSDAGGVGGAGNEKYDYRAQTLMTFSCLGNMKIDSEDLKGKVKGYDDLNLTEEDKKNGVGLEPLDSNGDGKITKDDAYFQNNYTAHNYSMPQSFAMGIAPGLNTTPNGDESWNIIDGINTAGYYDLTQRDNFVAFTAQNSLTVDFPVRLIVNPTRGSRLGDGFDKNYSIYKSMIFQAKDIVFNKQVDMMVSFYTPPLHLNNNARRMSSVVLAAPTNGYTYINTDRQYTPVNAGKVFFLEDCYIWIINYGNDGSGHSDNWYEVASTVYYKEKDLLKIKIASAGDVYLFNTDITMTQNSAGGKPVKTGFNLAAYAVEVLYMKNYNTLVTDATPWWDVWQKANQALFGWYLKSDYTDFHAKNPTYYEDDFHKLGNIYQGGGVDLSIPDSDQLYTFWAD